MFKKNILLLLTIISFSGLVFGEKIFEADNQTNAVKTLKRRAIADFDGDGKTDVSVYRPSDGNWYVWRSSDNTYQVTHFGGSNRDAIAPGDYDGDGKTDFAVDRDGVWYILNSATSTIRYEWFGAGIDGRINGDYDGDGKDDLALFQRETGTWFIKRSSDGFVYQIQFGASAMAVPADYDGDGKTDLAVFRGSNDPAEGDWYILRSSDLTVAIYSWGLAGGDYPVAADYDGDGLADLAVYRESYNGTRIGDYYILKSGGGYQIEHFHGNFFDPLSSGELVTRGDYDGDGKNDLALWNGITGDWTVKYSSTGEIHGQRFGLSNDAPIPNFQNP